MATELERLELSRIPGVVRVHQASFPGSFLSLLGQGALTSFYTWFAKSPGTIGFVFTLRGEVKGFVVGWEAGASWQIPMAKSCMMPLGLGLVGGIIASPVRMLPLLIQRLGVVVSFARGLLRSLADKHPKPQVKTETTVNSLRRVNASLLSIAVDPDVRRHKIASRLIELFVAEARRRSAPEVRLSVEPENIAARKLYEKAKWQRFGFEDRSSAIQYRFVLDKER